MQIQQVKRPWKVKTYHLAKWAWIVTAWIWTTIIIAFLAQFVANLLTTKLEDLQQSWTLKAIMWFQMSSSLQLKLVVLCLVLLLIAIPPFAFGLKQMLRDVEPQRGIDKLIDVLQQDTLSPQLEFLQLQLEQQLQKLDACVQALESISDLLQQTPTAANLLMLYTLSQQQYVLQEKQLQKLNDCIQSLKSISSLLQQMPTSSDLQRFQSAKISLLLEQMQESLKILARPSRQESGSLSDEDATTESFPIVVSPTPTN